MALPDAGQPDEYTEAEMAELLRAFEADKNAVTKNQKAAVARYNFKKSKGEAIAFRAPGAATAAGASPGPASSAAVPSGLDAWKSFAAPDVLTLAGRDPATLSKEEKMALAKGKSQAMKAMQAAGPAGAATAGAAAAATGGTKPAKKERSIEDVAREKALAVPLAKEAAAKFGAALDLGWQTKYPYLIVKDAAKLVPVAEWLRDEKGFSFFVMMTAVDYPPDRIETVYNLYNVESKQGVAIKVQLPRTVEGQDLPSVPSLVPAFPGADWYEREVYDLFGVRFDGHPNLTRIMMPEAWTGHPMRKDYDVTREQYVALGDDGRDIVSFQEADGW